jgi:protein LTV1
MDGEETRTRFTNYSMTSATIKRGDGLRLIDDRFEKLYEAYDEDEVGELEVYEAEDLAGHIEPNSDRMKQLVDEFEAKQHAKKYVVRLDVYVLISDCVAEVE